MAFVNFVSGMGLGTVPVAAVINARVQEVYATTGIRSGVRLMALRSSIITLPANCQKVLEIAVDSGSGGPDCDADSEKGG